MLTEFVLVSFASFIGWQIFRYFSFFPLSVRLAPLIAVAISYAFTWLYHPSILVAFAATGGVAVLNKVTDASSPDHLALRLPQRKERGSKERKPGKSKAVPNGVGHRIPIL